MKRISRIGGVSATHKASGGFTLLEMLISVAILVTVTGAVFEQINAMQKKSSAEAMKLDMNQQAREFLDQTVRDLHMAGYPGASMYSTPPRLSQLAMGLVRVSPTEILLEGDVNNDGQVYSVDITYVASDPNDPNCPCIRRSAQPKWDADSFSQPTNPNYTETQGVFSPGTGAGQSGEDLFAYYDQNGNAVPVGTGVDIRTPATTSTPAGTSIIAAIKTIKINLSLLNNQRDAGNNTFTRESMSATARINY
ncbi:MAG TPA: prepilin-type N-terminal cleavage/methylation domain-containing protein [Candidatus Angelobacter sp.]|jgi:prepilin-type N-terminal cleavage/methylation domain-containing protein